MPAGALALGRPITSILMPDLKHPLSYVGRQVGIPGALWDGRQTAAERETVFRCTIREFSYAHLFSGGFVPEKAWQVQEMGVSGSGSLEVGDSSSATSSGSRTPSFSSTSTRRTQFPCV